MLLCVCACVLFYNTKVWTQFYISLISVCAYSQYDQTLFSAYHLRWVYIPKTHTGLQKLLPQKNKEMLSNFMWRGIIMQKYPYIKLYLSVSNIYIALSIKHIISLTRLNLFLFQNMWFYSLMNVLFSSYHLSFHL